MTGPEPADAGARPPSAWRAVWLIVALELRRAQSRWRSLWRRRSGDRARSGTARKGAPSRLLGLFFTTLFAFNAVTMSTQIVHGVAEAAERAADPERAVVPGWLMSWLEWSLQQTQTVSADELRPMFERAALEEGVHDPAGQNARAEALLRLFEKRGRAGFRERQVEDSPWPSRGIWYAGESPRAMLAPLGLIALLLALSVTLSCVVGPNRELARVESSLEWWFTFPISARSLLLARVLQTALANPLIWFLVMPFFAVVFWCAGWGGFGVALGGLAAIYLGLLAGSLRVAAETVLRRLLSLRRVASVQSALMLVSSALALLFVSAVWPVGRDPLTSGAMKVPVWSVLYNPLSLPLAWLLGGRAGLWALLAALTTAALAVFGSVWIGAHMLRDGLTTSTGPNQGSRRRAPASNAPSEPLLGPIAHKELLSLLRDRQRAVVALIVPVLGVGLQMLINPGFGDAVVSAPQHASALAFGIAALVLAGGALPALASEGPGLWLLYTTPGSLDRALVDKAKLWAAIAAGYAGFSLCALAIGADRLTLLFSPHAALALAGVALYAFIAVALGALGTDVLAGETRLRTQPSTAYLFMLVAGLFSYALYTPSLWTKFVQLVLSSLLAFALWQKLRDNTPYLLDPTEAPPARIAVADGILAALGFFVLQGLLSMLFSRLALPPGMGLLFAFVGAGLLVTTAVVFMFWRTGVTDLSAALGLSAPQTRFLPVVARGLGAGLVAGCLALAYTQLVERLDWLRALREDSLRLFPADERPEQVVWLCLLAVFAAPLFEELIFRGVLYRGFRRSLGPRAAALASSLVFALVHPAIAFLPVFVMALLAANAFERSRQLLAPILAHMAYNALVVGGALFAP